MNPCLLTCRLNLLLVSQFLVLHGAVAQEAVPTRIAADERVLIFPQAASLTTDGKSWEIPIHGWIFEPEGDDFLRKRMLKRVTTDLGLVVDSKSLVHFDRRIRYFLVDNERRKRVRIRICGRRFTMPESSEDGHFQRTIRIGRRLVAQHAKGGWLTVDVPLPSDGRRSMKGRVQLRSASGVTVISDIDDTVKISDVRDKKRLIANTFLKEFQTAGGMPDLYQSWKESGADFTFVSASPWQLYPALSSWAVAAKFPPAAFNLRQIRFRDSSLIKLFDDPFESKVLRISTILRRFPGRRFILVGDSGEKDPEVYGELARRFPNQIAACLIRNVTAEAGSTLRMKKAFSKVPVKTGRSLKSLMAFLFRKESLYLQSNYSGIAPGDSVEPFR